MPLRKNGCCDIRGMTHHHRYPGNSPPCDSSQFLPPMSPQGTPVCPTLPPSKPRVSVWERKSCMSALYKKWLSSLTDRSSAAGCCVGGCSTPGCLGWRALPMVQASLLSGGTLLTLIPLLLGVGSGPLTSLPLLPGWRWPLPFPA